MANLELLAALKSLEIQIERHTIQIRRHTISMQQTIQQYTTKINSRFDSFVYQIQRPPTSPIEDHRGTLAELTQTSTVVDFQLEFENLMNRETGISERLLISYFVTGLKPEIRRQLLFSWPSSLTEAFALARTYETHAEDSQAGFPSPSQCASSLPDNFTGTMEISPVLPQQFDTSPLKNQQEEDEDLSILLLQEHNDTEILKNNSPYVSDDGADSPREVDGAHMEVLESSNYSEYVEKNHFVTVESYALEYPTAVAEMKGEMEALTKFDDTEEVEHILADEDLSSFNNLASQGNFHLLCLIEPLGLNMQTTTNFRDKNWDCDYLPCQDVSSRVACTILGDLFFFDQFVLPNEDVVLVSGSQRLLLFNCVLNTMFMGCLCAIWALGRIVLERLIWKPPWGEKRMLGSEEFVLESMEVELFKVDEIALLGLKGVWPIGVGALHMESADTLNDRMKGFCGNTYKHHGEKQNMAVETTVRNKENFAVPFSLPKLVIDAIPDFASGDMENYGLVIYCETALLYDNKHSVAANKQRVATVVVHEIAHQWIGNHVTMEWWIHLWLNEGFTSWDFILLRWRKTMQLKNRMMERLWGRRFFKMAIKKWTSKNIGSTTCKHCAVQFCYKPLKQIINTSMNDKDELWPKLGNTMKAEEEDLLGKLGLVLQSVSKLHLEDKVVSKGVGNDTAQFRMIHEKEHSPSPIWDIS